jgi:hypothetical protein
MMRVMIVVVVAVVVAAAATGLGIFLLFLLLLLLLFLFTSGSISPVGLVLYHQGIVRALGGTDTRPVNNRGDSELEIFLILLGQTFPPTSHFLATTVSILRGSTIDLL